jgi:hypothetical protein
MSRKVIRLVALALLVAMSLTNSLATCAAGSMHLDHHCSGGHVEGDRHHSSECQCAGCVAEFCPDSSEAGIITSGDSDCPIPDCPCHDHDSACPDCPCSGDCGSCMAKLPCADSSLISTVRDLSLPESLLDISLSVPSAFCGCLLRPPRS